MTFNGFLFVRTCPQRKDNQLRIIKAINELPFGDVKRLQGDNCNYRLRVGNYRIIFSKYDEKLIILIIEIGPFHLIIKKIILKFNIESKEAKFRSTMDQMNSLFLCLKQKVKKILIPLILDKTFFHTPFLSSN